MDSSTQTQPGFFPELWRELKEAWRTLADEWSVLGITLRNQMRLLRRAHVDYVVLPIGGPLPERDAPPRSFIQRQLPLPDPPLSMETLNRRLQAIGDAANTRGAILVFQGIEAGLATLQNLRRAIERLRARGKEVIVYTPYLDLPHYFVATAADRIIAPPSADFTVLGLRLEVTYLKDALERIGVIAEFVRISPYKTAYSNLSHADMTPEEREQFNWLLDAQFDLLLTGMAEGRGESHTPESLRALINQGPYTAQKAHELGLIDAVGYEDDLPRLLAEPTSQPTEQPTDQPANQPTCTILPWKKAAPLLLEKRRRRTHKYIGVISLEGNIVTGPSRNPPIDLPIPFIGGQLAGDQTITQLLRQAEQDENMAALVFYVDSRGGSALASDLIAREVARLNQKKPVLAYMGNVAASGGYYVSALARHIMAQSGTFTGSIGVINGRLSSSGLYQKLHFNPVHLDRGERAGLYRNNTPMTDEERSLFWQSIIDIYAQFKQVVSNGRSIPIEELDPICEGRVWLGSQAIGYRLVDSLGDFVDAVQQAARLANLPEDESHLIATRNLYTQEAYLPAPAFAPEILATLSQALLQEGWQALNGRALLLMPYTFRVY